MKSSLAIVMFVDLVGYSSMMEEDHADAMSVIRALKSEYLEPTVATFEGEVLKRMGDGWILSFPSVAAAVKCAADVQNRLAGQAKIKLRMGGHIGEVVEDEDDFYGAGLNIAQRIQTEAPPGGFMVSEDFQRQLPSSERKGLTDAGTFRLKNISQPVRLFQWRPVQGQSGGADQVPSIAVTGFEYAPSDESTRTLAADLRDQLLIGMSRRVGIELFDDEPPEPVFATYLLRGRLRVADGRGRLGLTLLLREESRPVWSETYEGQTDDVFSFCDTIMESAENDLRVQTNAFDGDRLAHLPDDQLSVSELRARGANCFYKASYDGWRNGLDLMERAVRLNPLDGVAHCMRVEAQMMLCAARYEVMSDALLRRATQDLDNAVEQTPRSDYVFWTRGVFRIKHLGDVTGARADLKRCRTLNPAYREGHELEGLIWMREAQFDDAAQAFARTLAHSASNPLNPYRLFEKSIAHLCDESFADAERDAFEALGQRPNDRGLRRLLALCQGHARNAESARHISESGHQVAFDPSTVSGLPTLPPEYGWLADALGPQPSR